MFKLCGVWFLCNWSVIDDEVKMKIFEKKVVYTFLLRFEIQDENVYSILGVFFDI